MSFGGEVDDAFVSPPSLNRYIQISEILERLTISRSTLYVWMEKGTFPKPYKLGPRRVAWREHDLIVWEEKLQKT